MAFILALLLFNTPGFKEFIMRLGKLGYLGAFLAGLLFVSTFTIATGSVILITLSQTLPIPLVILVAGCGAVIGDFLIYKFVKDNIEEEIKPIYDELVNKSHIKKILHTKYFSWTLPVLGTLIIASPLPDELGVSLLGISQLRLVRFLAISLLSHTIGMSVLIGAVNIL